LLLLTGNAQANELSSRFNVGDIQVALNQPEVVRNFHKVTANFYRSAQPEGETAFGNVIQRYRLETIISLRTLYSDEPMAARFGVRLLRYPLQAGSLNQENIIKALRALRTATLHGPTLLHCEHGSDRTGLITALYRILYQSWSKEAALEEMQQKAYGFHAIWKNIPDYIRNVNIDQLREAVGVS
jgi:protein tyrosine/serine phosphatase